MNLVTHLAHAAATSRMPVSDSERRALARVELAPFAKAVAEGRVVRHLDLGVRDERSDVLQRDAWCFTQHDSAFRDCMSSFPLAGRAARAISRSAYTGQPARSRRAAIRVNRSPGRGQ